jgi:hypothetical protein
MMACSRCGRRFPIYPRWTRPFWRWLYLRHRARELGDEP